MSPVFITRLEGLLDQHTPEPGTVDEKVALDTFAGLQFERRDETALAILLDFFDQALNTLDALGLAEGPQEFRVETGVEMIGIVYVGLVGREEPSRLCSL